MARTPLQADEITSALRDLPGWAHEGDALRKTFRFQNHREAMSFLVRLSYEAEQRDHHAEIHNVYATVELVLRTHDAGNRVTRADVELARAIESFSWV
ncbi:4a-hydroxytetrahydrobiopterin dehydratase [Sandaracinus amylolyticus]|uniref:Putative pterin-4-alpha-carbinolamine dehydratase n=1 Tax=Sandaracinus amylolyticus TaxID=927083 RepID=A0A0F6W2H8_9BACT|nr:4a-hydroxytetrahydrobiopterin dehydratase [Sandaracinus amylolyticus]AKF05767.1 Pterin-4-alpha-carbinolamine dehydratase [Sandaracinus amylolyticus]